MLRILLLCIMAAGLVLNGCSEKQDEADRLQQEAAEEDAAAVMDSLRQAQQQPDTVSPPPADTQRSRKPSIVEQEEPEPEPEPEYKAGEGFAVQVGSYSNRELADYWAERYRNWGYEAYVQSADIGGETYYRLRIGPYDTYTEAKDIGKLLVDRYSADFWVDNSQ